MIFGILLYKNGATKLPDSKGFELGYYSNPVSSYQMLMRQNNYHVAKTVSKNNAK